MNKKLQEMWDAAHEIPEGAYVPENTVLVQLDPTGSCGEAELIHYVSYAPEYWQVAPKNAPVRSLEPLPDPDDTGALTVHSGDRFIVLVDTYDYRCYDLTKSQARNLVRMLTEAIDGD